MIRFRLECLCVFSLIFELYAAPSGVHRVSRQDFATNGPVPGAAIQYQRPFEAQNGVYRVQRQDFTNGNDVPFSNSYQSPYVNRFSALNYGYGSPNRTYTPYPKLFLPANPVRPQNPYLAIGLPNYDRIVPASGFQAKTPAPQMPSYEEEGVLPALPHPPRYDLIPPVSETSKSAPFEEDFSSAVEVFDMTEDRKGICKGANCRKWDPNDDSDAVKPIRVRRSIDFEPMPDSTFGWGPFSRYLLPYYTHNRPMRRLSPLDPYPYPLNTNDDEYDGIRPPKAHLMKPYFYRADSASETTTYEPTTTESEVSTGPTELPPSATNLIDYDDNVSAENEAKTETTSSSSNEVPPENDYNQRVARSEQLSTDEPITESNDGEFADEFSQRVAQSELSSTGEPTPMPESSAEGTTAVSAENDYNQRVARSEQLSTDEPITESNDEELTDESSQRVARSELSSIDKPIPTPESSAEGTTVVPVEKDYNQRVARSEQSSTDEPITESINEELTDESSQRVARSELSSTDEPTPTPESSAEGTTAVSAENDYNQRVARSEQSSTDEPITESNDEELTDESSQRVAGSELSSTDEPTPTPESSAEGTTAVSAENDYNQRVARSEQSSTDEPSTESIYEELTDESSQRVARSELSSTDEPTPTPESSAEGTTAVSAENDYNQRFARSEQSSTDEPTSTPESPANDCNTESNDSEPADEFSQRVARSEEATSAPKSTQLEFEYNDSYAPLPAIDFGSTTAHDNLQVDYPTSDSLPEDHFIHTRDTSSETYDDFDFLELQAENLPQQTEPANTEAPIQARYSLSSAFICQLWPEMYTKNKSKVPYDDDDYDVAWNSLCNFIYVDQSRATEAPTTTTTTTESADVDFFEESDVLLGIGVENLESDLQNLLEAMEKMQIGGAGAGDIWPELPELDVRSDSSSSPDSKLLPEVLSSNDV